MTYFPQLHAIMATLVLIGVFGVNNAFAGVTSLYDLRPCPSNLAVEGGAKPETKWDLTVSPYTHHWKHNDAHKDVNLVALESRLAGGRFCGLALFTNSFGQPSAYGYIGQEWNNIFGVPKLFTKVSAGFIYGYKGEHKDTLSFNKFGIAPAIIPSLGYAFTTTDSAQVFMLGTAGLTFSYTRGF